MFTTKKRMLNLSAFKNNFGTQIIILFFAMFSCSTIYAHPENKTINQNILQRLMPSVVNISVQKNMDPQVFALLKQHTALPNSTKPPRLNYMGSGVIVDAKHGYIITNNHVVKQAPAIIVTLKSGDHYAARLVGADPSDDLAVLQIQPKEKLTALGFATADQIHLGQNVIAIGHPFGLQETVTAGIISALDRAIPVEDQRIQSFIQTDAPINPGNSGGALINQQGLLVGINTAILSNSDESAGIGFAIPSKTVHAVYMQLINFGKVTHGMLGVVVQNITPEIATAMHLPIHDKGIIVTQVNSNSAAAQAGIKIADVILEVNQAPINNAEQLHDRLSVQRPGSVENLNILRDNKLLKITAKLMSLQQATRVAVLPYFSGMQMANYQQLQPDGKYVKGIIIKSMSPTCNGSLAGLSTGDIITKIGDNSAPQVKELPIIARQNQQPLLIVSQHHGIHMLAVLNH